MQQPEISIHPLIGRLRNINVLVVDILPTMFRQMKIVGISVPFVFGRMTRSLLLITNQVTLIME